MRIKPLSLAIVGAALAGLVGLAVTLFGSDSRPSAEAAGEPDAGPSPAAKLAAKMRKRSVPRFETIEQPAAPPPPAEPIAVTPPPVAPPPAPVATPNAELRERASKDGYLFREQGSNAVYLVQNGTKFHIKSPEELYALGYNWDKVEVVPSGALTFLRDHPPEKSLLRERGSNAVFYYENGQKRHIPSQEMFEQLGHKWSEVKVVPNGGLASEPTGAPVVGN